MEVGAIGSWRWPVWFFARRAIRRKVAVPIGFVPIPGSLREFPILRSSDRQIGWVAVAGLDVVAVNLAPTHDWQLPISKIVNDVILTEMVESNWHQREHV